MKHTILAVTLMLLCTAVFAAANGLPPELKNTDKTTIFQMKPNRGKFSVADQEAENGYARRKIYPLEHKFGDSLPISYLMPKNTPKWGKGPQIPYASLPADNYGWVKWGTNSVVPGTAVVIDNDWGKALDVRMVGALCPPKGQKYTLFLRLKLQGPAFNPNSKLKENSISLDKLVFVKQ